MIIKVRNLLDQAAQYSYLSNGEAAAVGTLRVKNINAFEANQAIQVGKTGEELAEIRVIGTAAVSGTALIVTAATSYDHPTDTPVFAIKYDKVIFKRSTSGTAGTAVALSGGTVAITPDSNFTIFDDTSGDSAYAYKASFFNSVTSSASSDSDWLPGTGLAFYSLGKIRERIQGKLFAYGYVKDNDTIDDWINEWLEELTNAAVKANESYALGTVNVAFGTNGLGTIVSEDYKNLKRMWVTYNGNDKYRATRKDIKDIFPNEIFSSTHPYYAWRGDTVFEVMPSESGGTTELIYSKRNTVLVNDNDFLPLQMRSYTNSFVNYAISETYYSDNKLDRGNVYLTRANASKNDFISEITPRDFTGIEMMQINNVVSGEDQTIY